MEVEGAMSYCETHHKEFDYYEPCSDCLNQFDEDQRIREIIREQLFEAVYSERIHPMATGIQRHPSSQRFHDILKSLGDLHDVKQKGYGTPTDPFHNVRATSEWGVPSWMGAMVRATDKIRRLQAVAKGGILEDEDVLDLFDDLAVYSVIGRVLYEEESGRSMGVSAGGRNRPFGLDNPYPSGSFDEPTGNPI